MQRRIVRALRHTAVFPSDTTDMNPAYDNASTRALQPSRCGLHLRASAIGKRDARARGLLT